MTQHMPSATPQQTATPGTRHNVLYIGVGGTGVKTLKHIRQLHEASQANDTVIGDARSGVEPHYFVIDTDEGELAQARFSRQSEHRLEIGEAQTWFRNVSRSGDSRADKLRAWLPERMTVRDGAVVSNGLVNLINNNGAGQRRLVSRMVFYHNLAHSRSPLRAKLETVLTQLNNLKDSAQKADSLTIEIVFGLAGGTGSGCATHVGHVIREIVENTATGTKPTIRGHAFLDTAMAVTRYGSNRVRVQANVYAALMELEHFQKAGLDYTAISGYMDNGFDGWFVEDGSDRKKFAAHSGPTYDGVSTAPFDTIRLFELTHTQGARDTYAAAAECLYVMGIPAMSAQIASHESNLQAQMAVNSASRDAKGEPGPGLTAHYGAAGAAVLYLPRHRLATYLSHRISADALKRGLPHNLDFADFSKDPVTLTRLRALDEKRKSVAEVASDSDAASRQKMEGLPFVESIIELARGESRKFAELGHSGSDAIGMWGKLLRSASQRKSGASMARTFLSALEEAIQDPIRLAEHRIKGRLVAKKDAVTAAEGMRRTDIQQIDERIDHQEKKLAKRLASDDFWNHVTQSDADVDPVSEAFGISPQAVAELTLLYLLIGAGDDADIYSALTRQSGNVELPWFQWGPDDDNDPLEWFGTLRTSELPNPLNKNIRIRLSDGVKRIRTEMNQALTNAAERSNEASSAIRELSRPRRGLEILTGLFSGDSDEAAISDEVDKLDRDLKEMTNDTMMRYTRLCATQRVVETAFQAVLERLLAYGRLRDEVGDDIREFEKKANDLLSAVGGSGFSHDHEVLTDASGAYRYWDWYYEDQFLGGRSALLSTDVSEAPGARLCGELKVLDSNIMTVIQRSVSHCRTMVAAASEADSMMNAIAPEISEVVSEYLRNQLTLERAILLQTDYGRVEELKDRALDHEGSAAQLLAEFYEDIHEGRYARASWTKDHSASDVLKNIVETVVHRAGPMATIAGHEGSAAPPSDSRTYVLLGAIDPNLDSGVTQTFTRERAAFYDALSEASGLIANSGSNQAINVSPDRLFIVNQKLVLTLDAFPTVRRHAQSMLSELRDGLVCEDLFTSKYFVESRTSEDGRSVIRVPRLPMLSFEEQRAAVQLEERMEDEQRQALALALLLLSDDAEFVHNGNPGFAQFVFREGRWNVVIHWGDEARGSQILQIEEPRLLESARDFRAIVREATSGDALFYRDPKLELVEHATRDLPLLLDVCESLKDKLLAITGYPGDSSLDFIGTEALKDELREALDQAVARRYDAIPGSSPAKRFAAHHAADIARMNELVRPLLTPAPGRPSSNAQASAE